jgi:hypothetical protein
VESCWLLQALYTVNKALIAWLQKSIVLKIKRQNDPQQGRGFVTVDNRPSHQLPQAEANEKRTLVLRGLINSYGRKTSFWAADTFQLHRALERPSWRNQVWFRSAKHFCSRQAG